jgi:hypothetical protein
MIHIEITSHTDPTAIGLYDYEFDVVHIGRSRKNDLIFKEKDVPFHYMTLQIVEDTVGVHLVARNLPTTPFFFINGKKISGPLKVYPNDIITFGSNSIKILTFKKTKIEEDLTEAFENFSNNAKELRFALDFIEEVLLDIENKVPHV